MLAKRIIACLDVKNGRVVKGRNFRALKYAGEPVELAKRYAKEGVDEIVFLDISASGEKRAPNREWVKRTARELNIPFTVGGGIKSVKDIRKVLSLGADKISVNTGAIENPALIREGARKFGSQCIVAAIDAKREGNKWRVYSSGGKKATKKNAVEWAAECCRLGAGEILLTSIDRDGTREGFDLPLTRAVAQRVRIPVIASGGAGSPSDFLKVFGKGKADAALAAGVFHYGAFSILELKKFLAEKNIAVRLV